MALPGHLIKLKAGPWHVAGGQRHDQGHGAVLRVAEGQGQDLLLDAGHGPGHGAAVG